MKLSIVVPVYYNNESIPFLVSRLRNLAGNLPAYSFEFVFVDDGSGDESFQTLLVEHERDSRIKIIKLTKNYNSMVAIQAGLAYATGDCVGVISADLQDPPEIFLEMIKHWEQGKKVVLGVRERRHDAFLERLCASLYYFLLNTFALRGYPRGGFDLVLLDRSVADSVKAVKEKNTNIMNLIYWFGFDCALVEYTRGKRMYGHSRWTFAKKWKLFMDSFIAFSHLPIQLMSVLGILVAIVSFLYGTTIIILALFNQVPIRGYAALATLISFFSGTIMMMLGFVGEYVWRILDEVRKRPLYVVDKIVE